MKKVKVLKDVCIGCGACQAICSEVYEIDDDGLAKVIVDEVPEEVMEDAVDALENCPTGAIVEVEENDEKSTETDTKENKKKEDSTNNSKKEEK